MKKLTFDDFVIRSNIIHNNKYEYFFDTYIDTHTKTSIKCPIHGMFKQTPHHHLTKNTKYPKGCPKCGRLNCGKHFQKTKYDFIENSKKIHGEKYDYSLVDYKTAFIKVDIICKEHGTFKQTPNSHLRGSGCPKCCKNLKISVENFKIRCNIQHNNKYDYSLVNFDNITEKIKIICPMHGIFEIKALHHFHKHGGCKECHKFSKILKLDDFVNRCNIIYENKYDYSLVDYKDNRTKVKIICPKHGIFEKQPGQHLLGKGCQKCSRSTSKGEIYIDKWLFNHNITYIKEKTFCGCKDKGLLRFDFYLPDYNICIEFDGLQHYEPIYGLNNFIRQQHRDNIKTQYCLDNNIKLIRIPYFESNKIDELLNNYLS